MALFFDVTFECRSAEANNGKIVITADGEGALAQDWEVRVALKAPSGAIFRAKPVAADAAMADTDSGIAILDYDIPIGGDSLYQGGEYTVLFYVTDITGGGETLYTGSYLFEPVVAPDNLTSTLIELETSLNCLNGELVATDETDYTGWTRDSRSIKIVHPDIPGIATPADTTDTDSDVNVTVTHINVTYQAQLIVTVSKTDANNAMQGSDFTVSWFQRHTANLYEDVDVDCDNLLCDVLSCLEQRFTLLNAQACTRGGWAQVPAAERANFEYCMNLLQLAKLFADCNNSTKFRLYLNQAKELLNCSCGCAESGAVAPFVTVGGTESIAIIE